MKRYLTLAVMLMFAVPVLADDGVLFRKDISKTPELETEHASMKMLSFYVPAQSSTGELTPSEYYDASGSLVDNRDQAKPLISFYADGHVDVPEDCGGFSGHGHRDLYGAVSLDDGESWKRTNLSKSGDESSFTLKDGTHYPGDVVRLFDAVAGNKVLAVWASRYCRGGSPNYAMIDTQRGAIATYKGIEPDDDLYLNDLFGVNGSQKSSDFTDEGYPTVGEVPYSCMWAARGTLEEVLDDNGISTGTHEIVWRQAERLTSGLRDAHRMEVAGEVGVGFVVSWQEDPEGLRPGDGEGPGEGWSGAVAHHQTDIWYSYIGWDDFDLVDNADNDEIYRDLVPLVDYTGDGTPPVGIPMAMPVRLTDNAMCQTGLDEEGKPIVDNLYCTYDFNSNGLADFCNSFVTVTTTPPANAPDQTIETHDLCVTEDGRLLRGNIAATRARINLRAYDANGDGENDGAWVILAYEESKGLGEEEFDADETYEFGKMDMGKNIWYHTFNMIEPELISQGLMLNAPAVYPDEENFSIPQITGVGPALKRDGDYMKIVDDPIYAFTEPPIETELYQTEIARRFSLISQKSSQVGDSNTVAFATWKQGIIRQGGPADVMARRFKMGEGSDPATVNPYAYKNMVCDNWKYTDSSNPRYIKGLCMDQPLNMSGTSILQLGDTVVGDDFDSYTAFPWNDRFDDIDMSTTEDPLAKMTYWEQTADDLGLTSWDNPFDVAKGHRGFIDGDFIMLLYAWSPNWLANTVGHDNYNLYIRRSFDGGSTWTTTPADLGGDGTTTCEWQGPAGTETEEEICTDYTAGEFEQARNVSQLVGLKETILDPRYAPTSPLKSAIEPAVYEATDVRDPSKFFVVFETGDNTTVEVGEAEPLDLYYSRATNWGDDYDLVDTDGDGVEDYFDWLEGSSRIMSGEASVVASPGGDFFYALWNQETLDRRGNVIASDAWFRRVMYLDDEPTDDTDVETGDDTEEGPFVPPSGGGKNR